MRDQRPLNYALHILLALLRNGGFCSGLHCNPGSPLLSDIAMQHVLLVGPGR